MLFYIEHRATGIESVLTSRTVLISTCQKVFQFCEFYKIPP